jgi:mycothiol synthase
MPVGFRARVPTLEDLPAVLALRNRCSRETKGHDEYTPETLRGEWLDPAFDLATEGIVVENDRGEIVAWEEVYDRSSHVLIEFEAGTVHPDVRGQGIEESLVSWVEATAQRHVAQAPLERDVVLRATKHSADAFARELLESAGLRLARHFFAMEIRLDGAIPEPAWPEGITVRNLEPGRDERAFFAAKRDAFRGHWGIVDTGFEYAYERHRQWIENTPGYDPSLFRAAMDGDEIAGICFTWPSCAADPDQGLVSHLGVRPAWRRRGIAMALLHDAFAECHRRGKTSAALGVDTENVTGATELYEKAGMRVTARYDSYVKVLRPGTGGGAAAPEEDTT